MEREITFFLDGLIKILKVSRAMYLTRNLLFKL